jgi:DNA-binding NarL/FixJ family response regulator
MHQIRVMIADDHPVVREGLTAILKSQQDIDVVAEAADGAEACELYDRLVPDVLILDLRMPKKDGLQVLTELSSRVPAPRIFVMTVSENDEDVRSWSLRLPALDRACSIRQITTTEKGALSEMGLR